MSTITILLLIKAFERSGTDISMVMDYRTWSECVTYEPEMHSYYLWYNTKNRSTTAVLIKSDKIEE